MTNTLQKAYAAARQLPEHEQERLGIVLDAAMDGRTLTPAEVEEEYMIRSSLQGLAEAERGEGITVEEWQAELADLRTRIMRTG